MATKSKIEWTDTTWNPVIGCNQISLGCGHCYAKTQHDMRHKAYNEGKRVPKQYAKPFEVVQVLDDRFMQPFSWQKPRMVFVNSMSDLFHDSISDTDIARLFAVMESCPKHTFQILTKRPERMRLLLGNSGWSMYVRKMGYDWLGQKYQCRLGGWNDNIWIGVSVENKRHGLPRINHLRSIPWPTRFLSCEPLLEDLGAFNLAGIDWVIVGGESGTNARPMRIDWVHSIVQQCKNASVACFVKQLGKKIIDRNDRIAWNPDDDMTWPDSLEIMGQIHEHIHGHREEYQGADVFVELNHPKGGDPIEWPLALRVREFPR